MKSRISQCQKSCDDLKQKFEGRVTMDINRGVKEIKGDVKEIGGDVKEIGGDVKEIGNDVQEIGGDMKDIQSDSMYRVRNGVYGSRLIMMVVDANIQNTFKIIKDAQLGSYEFQFCPIFMIERLLVTAEKVFRWLSAPDSSKNYHEAREKHQKDTCSWFLNGTPFRELREKADILWIKGTGRLPDKYHRVQSVINNPQRGAVKPFYGKLSLGPLGN